MSANSDVVAIGSVRGSPGSTTFALAVALAEHRAGRECLLVEADPAGGTLAGILSVPYKPGLVELAETARHSGAVDVASYSRVLGCGVQAVLAPPGAEQARWALEALGEHWATVLAAQCCVLDLGRLDPASPSLAIAGLAQETVLVLRGDFATLHAASARSEALKKICRRVGVVLRGPSQWSPGDIADDLGMQIRGRLPENRQAAEMVLVAGEGRRSRQVEAYMQLVDSMRLLGDDLPGGGEASKAMDAVASEEADGHSAGAAQGSWPSLIGAPERQKGRS